MAYSDVRSQYKPIRPAFMGAVATAVVLFVLGKFIGSKDVGYDKLYNLGLALPARLTDSGLQLGDYVVVSGSAFLAWLSVVQSMRILTSTPRWSTSRSAYVMPSATKQTLWGVRKDSSNSRWAKTP